MRSIHGGTTKPALMMYVHPPVAGQAQSDIAQFHQIQRSGRIRRNEGAIQEIVFGLVRRLLRRGASFGQDRIDRGESSTDPGSVVGRSLLVSGRHISYRQATPISTRSPLTISRRPRPPVTRIY